MLLLHNQHSQIKISKGLRDCGILKLEGIVKDERETLKLAVVRPETASENTVSRTTFCSLVMAPWLPLNVMYGAYITPTGLHTHVHNRNLEEFSHKYIPLTKSMWVGMAQGVVRGWGGNVLERSGI